MLLAATMLNNTIVFDVFFKCKETDIYFFKALLNLVVPKFSQARNSPFTSE